MPKVILLNKVERDGIGDFSHFEGIYIFLRDNFFSQSWEFIPVICCDNDPVEANIKSRFTKILAKLENLEIPLYFMGNAAAFKESLSRNKDLIQCFSEAEQIINISSNMIFDVFGELLGYCRPNIILKYIGEHESTFMPEKWLSRSLGLSKDCYGLKIKPIQPISDSEAFSIIEQKSPAFANTILQLSGATSFANFKEHVYFAAAYYQYECLNDLQLFLLLFSANQSLPPHKNIIIYLSSNHIYKLWNNIKDKPDFYQIFEHYNLRKIVWVKDSGKQVPREINPDGSRSIFIVLGYNLCDISFEAIYHCLDFVAATGDNTLEKAFSYHVLPLYRSYNFSNKRATLREIARIISTCDFSFSKKIIEDFLVFFDGSSLPVSGFQHPGDKSLEEFAEAYKKIDLQALLKAWPVVSRYLTEQRNFYNRLASIFLERVEPTLMEQSHSNAALNLPVKAMTPQIVFTADSKFAFFNRKQNKNQYAALSLFATINILYLLSDNTYLMCGFATFSLIFLLKIYSIFPGSHNRNSPVTENHYTI